jgi:hypothetical protein
MMQTDAWRALPSTAQALYPWIKLEWRGPTSNNNGKIRLSVRQAAACLGVSINTAAVAFHHLLARGFIVVTRPARLGIEGAAQSPTYELTEIALPHDARSRGRRLYQEWREGGDYTITKAAANNPTGKRGKTKPRHSFEDRTVTDFETVWINSGT